MIASERERCACRRLTPHHRHIDAGRPGLDDFDGFAWAEWTSHHWEIPITACVVYLVGIFLLKRFMAERKRRARVAQVAPGELSLLWDLSAASVAGVASPGGWAAGRMAGLLVVGCIL